MSTGESPFAIFKGVLFDVNSIFLSIFRNTIFTEVLYISIVMVVVFLLDKGGSGITVDVPANTNIDGRARSCATYTSTVRIDPSLLERNDETITGKKK